MHRVNRRIQTRGDAAIAAICSRPPESSRSEPARPGSGTQSSSLTRLRRTVGTHSMSGRAACPIAQATTLYRSGSGSGDRDQERQRPSISEVAGSGLADKKEKEQNQGPCRGCGARGQQRPRRQYCAQCCRVRMQPEGQERCWLQRWQTAASRLEVPLGRSPSGASPLEERRVCPVAVQRCTVPNAW